MRPLLCALAGLALLRATGAFAAAEPFSPSRRDPARSSVCDRHMAIQGRLDVMEETVEKTVEHLEAEVKGLLGLLEELAWNLPPGPFSLAPDLLGDGEWLGWQRGRPPEMRPGNGASRTGMAGPPHGCPSTSRERLGPLGQEWGGTPPPTPHLGGCCSPASGQGSRKSWPLGFPFQQNPEAEKLPPSLAISTPQTKALGSFPRRSVRGPRVFHHNTLLGKTGVSTAQGGVCATLLPP
ncbi:placenta-specific protein 9 isoform X1 [Loxodonta africana]|uniref:placenta-specific protein 9 isoform X1 n=1 Tax=Loxodonta africana TaxID=9785 RepID=UPI0030CD4A7D